MMKCVGVLSGGDVFAEGKGEAGPNEDIFGVIRLVGGLVRGRFKVSSMFRGLHATAG